MPYCYPYGPSNPSCLEVGGKTIQPFKCSIYFSCSTCLPQLLLMMLTVSVSSKHVWMPEEQTLVSARLLWCPVLSNKRKCVRSFGRCPHFVSYSKCMSIITVETLTCESCFLYLQIWSHLMLYCLESWVSSRSHSVALWRWWHVSVVDPHGSGLVWANWQTGFRYLPNVSSLVLWVGSFKLYTCEGPRTDGPILCWL